jgi:hypothetical protein
MDDLEIELRRALQREEPPKGFADRVVGRTHVAHALLRAASRLFSTPKLYVQPERRFPRWAAAAAAVLVLAGAAYGYRWRQGEAAKREVLLAFKITSVKLTHIQTQVSR